VNARLGLRGRSVGFHSVFGEVDNVAAGPTVVECNAPCTKAIVVYTWTGPNQTGSPTAISIPAGSGLAYEVGAFKSWTVQLNPNSR
jgi:hypothetical protein